MTLCLCSSGHDFCKNRWKIVVFDEIWCQNRRYGMHTSSKVKKYRSKWPLEGLTSARHRNRKPYFSQSKMEFHFPVAENLKTTTNIANLTLNLDMFTMNLSVVLDYVKIKRAGWTVHISPTVQIYNLFFWCWCEWARNYTGKWRWNLYFHSKLNNIIVSDRSRWKSGHPIALFSHRVR